MIQYRHLNCSVENTELSACEGITNYRAFQELEPSTWIKQWWNWKSMLGTDVQMSAPSFQLPKCNDTLTLKATQCPQPVCQISPAFDRNCLSTLQAEYYPRLFITALCMHASWYEHIFLEIWGCSSGSNADEPSSNTPYYTDNTVHTFCNSACVPQTQELYSLQWGKWLY